MTPDTIMLAGLILGFIGMLAYLEDRAAKRQARHDKAVTRLYWPGSPPARPRPFTEAERLFYARPPKSSDLLPWR